MDVIVFTRADGKVTIRNLQRNASDAEFDIAIQHAINSGKAADTPQRVSRADVETDRTFRSAWERDLSIRSTVITINMVKARIIHMDVIRMARNQELLRVDNNLKVVEDTNDTAEIARLRVYRQSLRDIPQTFDLTIVTTPTALKTLWPPELPR